MRRIAPRGNFERRHERTAKHRLKVHENATIEEGMPSTEADIITFLDNMNDPSSETHPKLSHYMRYMRFRYGIAMKIPRA